MKLQTRNVKHAFLARASSFKHLQKVHKTPASYHEGLSSKVHLRTAHVAIMGQALNTLSRKICSFPSLSNKVVDTALTVWRSVLEWWGLMVLGQRNQCRML